jgi:hypothetical protein
MGVTHYAKSVVELFEPLLDRGPVQEAIGGHGKVKVPIDQPLSILPRQHHAKGRVEFGVIDGRIAKCEDGAGI